MSYTVKKVYDNGYCVVDEQGVVAKGPFDTNAQAWREVERLEHEPVSRRENMGEWIANKILRGE